MKKTNKTIQSKRDFSKLIKEGLEKHYKENIEETLQVFKKRTEEIMATDEYKDALKEVDVRQQKRDRFVALLQEVFNIPVHQDQIKLDDLMEIFENVEKREAFISKLKNIVFL